MGKALNQQISEAKAIQRISIRRKSMKARNLLVVLLVLAVLARGLCGRAQRRPVAAQRASRSASPW